jgi:hypothetical protein
MLLEAEIGRFVGGFSAQSRGGVVAGCADDAPDDEQQQGAQKLLDPAQEQAEVVTGSGEHGVALTALEIIAVHTVTVLEMTDHRLDGRASAHLAADRLRDAAHLTRDPNAKAVWMVVAAVALVDVDTANLDTGEPLIVGDAAPCSYPEAIARPTNCAGA